MIIQLLNHSTLIEEEEEEEKKLATHLDES